MTTLALETTVLFPSPMKTEADALAKATQIRQTLEELRLSEESTRRLVADTFKHIALNAVQQLEPGETAHAAAVHVTRDNAVRLFVSDSGDGSAASLAKNLALTPQDSDMAASLLAAWDGVSGQNDPERGRGLHLVMEQAR